MPDNFHGSERIARENRHWFSLLAVMAAVAVLMQGSSAPRVLICGALSGVGAALGFAGFLLWEGSQHRATWRGHLAQLLRLIVPLFLAWLVLSAYFIFKLGLSTLFYFQATYRGEAYRTTGVHRGPGTSQTRRSSYCGRAGLRPGPYLPRSSPGWPDTLGVEVGFLAAVLEVVLVSMARLAFPVFPPHRSL